MTHPVLPAGYNSDPNNGDEVDGAGTNWTVWPTLIDTFERKLPLILTAEMLAAFDDCADVVVDCVPDTVLIPFEDPVVEIAA